MLSKFPGVIRLFVGIFIVFGVAMPAQARWQCVTYARHVSDFEIRGNAHTWWASAEDIHERGSVPEAGSVMVLRPHGRMRLGHVAVVREIVNERQIRLNHANWSRRGMVESNVLAEDVSANNDWSVVKVWHTPSGQLGVTSYPVYGFIYRDAAGTRDAEPDMPRVVIASADTSHLNEPARVNHARRTARREERRARRHVSATRQNTPRDLIGDVFNEAE